MAYAASRTDVFAPTEFRIGQVLSKTLAVFFQNIVLFSLIAGAVSLPAIIYSEFVSPNPQTQGAAALIGFALAFFLAPLGTAIILHAAFQSMRGRPVRLAESTSRGLARFLSLLGVMILQTLGVGLGMILLIVPGLILMVMWYVAVPATVVEQIGPVSSLGRSRQLTKGFRWKLFGLLLLALLLSAIGGGAIAFVTYYGSHTIQAVTQAIWSGLSGGFSSVLIAVTYYYLRVAKEGVDIDQIAAVFD